MLSLKKVLCYKYLKFKQHLHRSERKLKVKNRILLFTDKKGNILFFNKLGKRYLIKYLYLPKFVDLIRWILIDWIRGKQEKIFGIWMFCGLFGEGKTISMVKYAEELKNRMPDISIYTNFGYVDEDGQINTVDDILNVPNRTIVIIDEIQNTFESGTWKNFPIQLLTELTQCRKKQLMIMGSAQVYSRVTKQIRELSQYVVQCSNWGKLDRLFINDFYHAVDYDSYLQARSTGNEYKVQPFMKRTHVTDDMFYQKYKTENYANVLKMSKETC